MLAVDGLSAPVSVVRDRFGVPHITAATADDLFLAQGFVQAGDRLFQMDLWRRSVQGRLAEVFGVNFVGRDAATRRMQYHGDLDAEWASYGPDTRAIATAFVRGINAWVAVARERPPQEFVLAGWLPDFWRPEDLLNRTDAFTSSDEALREVLRARLVAALGLARAGELLAAGTAAIVPAGLDPAVVTYAVGDVLRSVGTAPFFVGLEAPVAAVRLQPDLVGSNAWAVAASRSATGAPLVATDPHRPLGNPSLRYLVHLTAPGWNVIGATAPWLPGVVIGHNERVAWGMASFPADVQDVYVERLNPANRHQVEDRGQWTNTTVVLESLWLKGRKVPIAIEREYTPHGVMFAIDSEKNLAFTVRWSGAEPGGAGELASLALDRAASAAEFREALGRWTMPPAEFVYADRDGQIGSQVAARVPIRSGWTGTLPAPSWTGAFEWKGWRTLDELPKDTRPGGGYVALANRSLARSGRLRDVFAARRTFTLDDLKNLQHDVLSWTAERLVPLAARIRVDREDVMRARQQLLAWDRKVTGDSVAAAIYVTWERAIRRMMAEQRLERELATEFVARNGDVFVPALTSPSRRWFDGDVIQSRDALLARALTAAVDELRVQGGSVEAGWTWGRLHTTTFSHPLAITDAARRLFAIGPFGRAGYGDTLMSTAGPQFEATTGASFSAIFDVGDWDRSVAQNAPGQSGSPASPHFGDLAKLWAAGEYFPLPFSDAAVQAQAESTLTLVPRQSQK
ncbi:MAG: penicillin acylase family protein [Vicinamibacterales bacterium]